MSRFDLVIRNARREDDSVADIAIVSGAIVSLSGHADGAREFDARGALALPGLHDHHLHLFAAAARRDSADLGGLLDPVAIAARLQAAAGERAPGSWLRAVAYDERALEELPDREVLDRWAPLNPLRLQDRTGALWVLNSAALARLAGELPPGCERDPHGAPTGRFWREDAWLGQAIGRSPPDLSGLGRDLARLGVTGVTDAGATNDGSAARLLAGSGLAQRLMVMGSEDLPAGAGYVRGALKLMIDERDPPSPDDLAARIGVARAQGRGVAAHCATATELALFLAALDAAGGARRGDRIEHGSDIPAAMIGEIAARRPTVVTNPVLVHDRGDRYLATIAADETADLYRAASLVAAGIPLAAGSDAPYGQADPWLALRTACRRRTAHGHVLGPAEALAPARALDLFLGDPAQPGKRRHLVPAAAADIVLLDGSLAALFDDFDPARILGTVIAGSMAYQRD